MRPPRKHQAPPIKIPWWDTDAVRHAEAVLQAHRARYRALYPLPANIMDGVIAELQLEPAAASAKLASPGSPGSLLPCEPAPPATSRKRTNRRC